MSKPKCQTAPLPAESGALILKRKVGLMRFFGYQIILVSTGCRPSFVLPAQAKHAGRILALFPRTGSWLYDRQPPGMIASILYVAIHLTG